MAQADGDVKHKNEWIPPETLARYGGSRYLAIAAALGPLGNVIPGFVNKVPRVKFGHWHYIGAPRIPWELQQAWAAGYSDFDGVEPCGRLWRSEKHGDPPEPTPIDPTPLFLVASGSIAVLDIDRMEMLPTVLKEVPGANDALWVTTGRQGGGLHIWFHTPEKVQSRNAILPGVDLKAHGAYVVAPGALHASGVEYRALEMSFEGFCDFVKGLPAV